VLAISLAACGGNDDGASTTATPATAAGGRTEAVGAGSGDVAQFTAPEKFWCLDGDPSRAQAALGWSVSAAAAIKVSLDGERQGRRFESFTASSSLKMTVNATKA